MGFFSYEALHLLLLVLEMVTVPDMRETKTLTQFPGTLPSQAMPLGRRRQQQQQLHLTDCGNNGDTVMQMTQESDTSSFPTLTSEELLNTNCLLTNQSKSIHYGCFRGQRGKAMK